jgi:hypothetical protein
MIKKANQMKLFKFHHLFDAINKFKEYIILFISSMIETKFKYILETFLLVNFKLIFSISKDERL